jgi:hypothetical protein
VKVAHTSSPAGKKVTWFTAVPEAAGLNRWKQLS